MPTTRLILASAFFFLATSKSLEAQEHGAISRLTVLCTEATTKVTISDFPKKTSVLIADGNDNLLAVLSTNNKGAASTLLPLAVKTSVIVMTVDGEITVSNKVQNKRTTEKKQVKLVEQLVK